MISCNLFSFISSFGGMYTEHMLIGLCKVALFVGLFLSVSDFVVYHS